MKTSTLEFEINPIDNSILANLLGTFDSNIRSIENELNIQIKNRGNLFLLEGQKRKLPLGERILLELHAIASKESIDKEKVHLVIKKIMNHQEKPSSSTEQPTFIKTPRREIQTRNMNQYEYIQSIRNHDVTFGIGPAGTGKTYLAVAAAIESLQRQDVKRIILVRPAVEAGENLGFLPGDLSQKVDPYLRPMYDALYEMMGFEQVSNLIERRTIELAPLAFMRGRSLNESFIILDEAQNTTVEQMKMFLTRMGFGSKSVVNGDITQIDLPTEKKSGLEHALSVVSDIDKIASVHFSHKDVVRHRIVQEIVEAYEKNKDSK
ncbi:MAG: PhoH family protein [Pseudomonadota bacterium]|nr:PhoH family protein [Pseudomonadota bacterium]MED5270777.1 PhoH family protein [Pseudomonadota bacterium]MED6342902.1 PhoH family protein [Pseudomonadota bacterium]